MGKPKQRVQFSSHSSLILYNDTHQQDYYDEEQVSTSCYTREEEKLFKQLAKCEIELLRCTAKASGVSTMNNLHEQLQISPVGLERSLICDECTLRRANSRRQVSRAVFCEQLSQICCRHVADMSATRAYVANFSPTLHVYPTRRGP